MVGYGGLAAPKDRALELDRASAVVDKDLFNP